MRYLPIAEIQIPANRQRREFLPDALMELTESIRRNGLIHPIVVRYENKVPMLAAGERRLRAIQTLWDLGESLRFDGGPTQEGMIPTISMGDLSALEALEVEIEENIRRVDFTWQEKALAYSRFDALRALQARNEGKSHNLDDTAKEITGNQTSEGPEDDIKKAIIVARYLDDAEVAGAKTAREAFKVIIRKEEAEKNTALAIKVGATFGKHSHRLIMGDCLDWMAGAEAAQFDVILTDPPYGMEAQDFGDAAGRLVGIDHQYEDSLDSFQALMQAAVAGIDKVAKKEAHLYICCDIDQFHWLRDLFNSWGWKVFRTPLINFKLDAGRVPLPEHGPRRCYETILYAYRGGKRCTAIYPDVIQSRGDENRGHGAQKPVELFANLLRRSVRPGDRVFDPFAGTGTIFEAAHQLRASATGVEREPQYYGIAADRIQGLE